jgi:hypothetical protein
MTDDLSALPQPVREAMLVMDDWLPQTDEDGKPNVWRIVRAELLRLYAENSANVKSLNMLYGEKFSDRTYAALKSRMEHAETELAKLRARIAGSSFGTLDSVDFMKHKATFDVSPDFVATAHRFALVKLDDDDE